MLLLLVLVVAILPAVTTAALGWRPSTRTLHLASCVVLLALAVWLAVRVLDAGTVRLGGHALQADALAAFMVLVVATVALLAVWSASGYLDDELAHGHTTPAAARLFGSLLPAFVATMLLALLAGNAAVAWIAIEGTTITTVFLVGHRRNRPALEASWKSVIIGSVGIALAFLGTIVLAYAVRATGADPAAALNWDSLGAIAGQLDPSAARLAGGLLLLGYGTKIGLAPMHTWLPDAHSQAPAPVSALMSGVLLAVAFSVFLRLKVIVDAAAGPHYMRGLLVAAALLSLLVAAAMMLAQRDAKRLLAYSSIEHMGVIAFAAAVGTTLAVAALLLHVLAHALGKSAAFLAVGELPALDGTTRIAELRGLLIRRPVLGGLLAVAAFALLGLPPFALFASEIAVARAGFDAGLYWQTSAIFAVLFVVSAALLYQTGRLVLGTPAMRTRSEPAAPSRLTLVAPVAIGLVALGLLGITVWPIDRLLDAATRVVTG
ncbi:MAG: proton-conducting transporter membrane subunit [Acidimicrobiia bacterium]|nr:proton-conducting transporter membrane subunit [Acidimicrobiia bacterium]